GLTAAADEPGGGVSVINGEPAAEGQYPWVVALALAGNTDVNFCGGSLIAPDVVLTAAHCIRNEEPGGVVVRHGSVDLRSDAVVDVAIESLHVADDYGDPTSAANDWGLIKLVAPIEGVQILPLAGDEAHDSGVFEVMGWGWVAEGEYPTVLQRADVPFIDDTRCGEAYQGTGQWHAESMLCAGYWDAGGVDTCEGDSGGPMISRDENGAAVQVGIVSWGVDCAKPKQPGVYTQVSYLDEAIWQAVAGLG
ncbi:MAG: S1 family peptidase, partial [Stackebrandtia sp.]